MKSKNPLGFQDHTIPVEEAVSRTTQWRALYKETMKCPDEQILRAFFIPLEDILEIYNYYQTHAVPILGVRGYLAYIGTEPITPGVYNTDFVLCPVGLDKKDILTAPTSLELGDSSTIYDFTAPCPTTCDTSSALYSDTNLLHPKK